MTTSHRALAVRAARRRRLRRATVSVLAAIALLATGAWLLRVVQTSPGPLDPVYPPGATGALPLPADRPVGPASMVYVTCPSCPPRLVVPDGRQFALPAGDGLRGYTLSPDGRWLGSPDGDGYQLRDLTGTAVRRLTGPSRWRGATWSTNGRRLVLRWNRPNAFTVVDLDTDTANAGNAVTAAVGEAEVFGVLDTGVWLLAGGDGANPTLSDHDTGTGSSVARHIDPVADPGEFAGTPVLLACACHAIIPVYRPASAGPVALVEVDLTDGHIVTRRRLSDGGDLRVLAGQPDGVMLMRLGGSSTELLRLDERSGRLRVVSTLPADTRVVVRGSTGN